ncbi:hypothetical protein MTO96_029680 [Rhipicephalus appendiculatus]
MFRGAGKHEPATPRTRCSRSVSREQGRGTTSSRTTCPLLTDDVARSAVVTTRQVQSHGTIAGKNRGPAKAALSQVFYATAVPLVCRLPRPRRPVCLTPAASSCLPEEQGELLKALLYGRWISWGGKRPPPAVEATILSTVPPGELCEHQEESVANLVGRG